MSDIVQTLRQLDQQIEKLLQDRDGLRIEVDRRRAEVGRPGNRIAELGVSVNKHRAEACRLGDRVAELERQLAAKAEPAPDGHEWQPVDADHPLTAEDHRRMVRQRNGEEWMVSWRHGHDTYPARLPDCMCGPNGRVWLGDHTQRPLDIIAVLRPKPAPEPPTPQPGEVWECVIDDTGTSLRHGEIVSTRCGLVCLVDADNIGDRQIAFSVGSRNWIDRKLTRRVS